MPSSPITAASAVLPALAAFPRAAGPLDAAPAACNDVAHGRKFSITVNVQGVEPLGIPRAALRRLRRAARRGQLPTRHTPPRCKGERVPRFNERGEFRGVAWFGYNARCGCPGCRREHERRSMRVIRRHGDMREAAHIVLTVPEALRGSITLDRLASFRAAALRAVRRALPDTLAGADPTALGGLSAIHPAGDDEHAYKPHIHVFVTGPGLDALASGRVRTALCEALRVEWRAALARLCRVRSPAVTAPFVRWYPVHVSRDTEDTANDASQITPLARALRRDACRSFPGWNVPTRLAFFGTLRDVEPGERHPSEPLFDAGAIPVETIREAQGEARTHVLLSRNVLDFYAAREAERTARESACLAPAAGGAASIPAASAASSGRGRKFCITVNVVGVAPYTPLGRVGIRVAAADGRLAHALANLARRTQQEAAFLADEEARKEVREALGLRSVGPALVLRSVRCEIEALVRDVVRRARPSVAPAAEWLSRALRAITDGAGPLPDAPPLQVSGLLTLGELRFPFEQLAAATKAADAALDAALGGKDAA